MRDISLCSDKGQTGKDNNNNYEKERQKQKETKGVPLAYYMAASCTYHIPKLTTNSHTLKKKKSCLLTKSIGEFSQEKKTKQKNVDRMGH